jgi:hypothetical protein
MHSVVSVSCAIGLSVLVPAVGQATPPGSFDILGLRLGMAEPQVDVVLLRQGVPASRISREASPCQENDACDVTILAPTLDGTLTVKLVATAGAAAVTPIVVRIAYTLKGTAMGETAMITSSVLGRFGSPDQVSPMTWCESVTADRACPANKISLRYSPETLTVVLAAGLIREPTKK